MHKKQLIERVTALAKPICERFGVLLWEVSFEKEGKNHVLTIFIDRVDGGVFIDDCEKVSRALDPELDAPEFDSLPSYTLSVSSAGVERRLTRPAHFEWAVGKAVEVSFYSAGELGSAAIGRLLGYETDTLTLELNGAPHEIPTDKIAGVRMHFTF